MTQYKRQIVAALATVSMILTPTVSAATSLEISGNGSSSDNDVKVERSNATTVVQSNSAVVTNNVSSNSSTGGNKANDNTGGDVMIKTGDASSDVTVENTLNSNIAKVDCCDQGDISAKISGNGSDSENEIDLGSGHGRRSHSDKTEIQVFQDNTAEVTNEVDSTAKTGGNDTKRNTGGDVIVRTGDATATADVSTTANTNVAQVGGHGEQGNTVSALITGNGSESDNSVELDLNHKTSIVQDNLAEVQNKVDAYAKTGWNNANDNTGGEVAIMTGDADAYATVDNMVNFNAAEIDCGCLLDATAKISGNGYDSENEIEAKLGEDRSVFQGGKEGNGNLADLSNDVESEAKTGVNDAKYNTGEAEDPLIWTGDATSATEVTNTGNSNVYGDMPSWWPEVEWDFSFSHIWGM